MITKNQIRKSLLRDIRLIKSSIIFFENNIKQLEKIISDPEFREYEKELFMEITSNEVGVEALRLLTKKKKKRLQKLEMVLEPEEIIYEKKLVRQCNYRCPSCLTPIWESSKYCYECGQEFTWGFLNEE